ncbi:hypothetical protein E7T06_09430 [Deinococcus sp. Arct2-2]|nr:hypothetical protein E7T06_09430 [Deinococcus sp. Arct2-2]
MVTLHRIGTELDLAKQNIWLYVRQLQNRGLIVYTPKERFTTPIHLSEAGWALSEVPRASGRDLQFPILGQIAAGQPTLADDQIEAYVTRLQDVLDLHEGDFLLRVRGHSMIGIGIYDGDLVAIHPQEDEPLKGEIVLVTIPRDNTATLKRWERKNGIVKLSSENPHPDYDPMEFPVEEVLMQGCLVGHIGTGRSRRAQNGE